MDCHTEANKSGQKEKVANIALDSNVGVIRVDLAL